MNKLVVLIALALNIFLFSCKESSVDSSKSNIDSSNVDTLVVKKIDSSDIFKMIYLTDIAKVISGIPVDKKSDFLDITLLKEWQDYRIVTDEGWEKFFNLRNKVAKWSKEQIASKVNNYDTVFYPFSGPDILFATTIFPNARHYFLVGLEKPGNVPDSAALFDLRLKGRLFLYRKSINDVLSYSFFRTIDMNVELSNDTLDGVTPILMIFLVRANKEVLDIFPVHLAADGSINSSNFQVSDSIKTFGVRIVFRDAGDTTLRYLTYFSTDLSNIGLLNNRPFRKFVASLDTRFVTYLKSASFLMHKPYFSIIRNAILHRSAVILQDDSGISYKYFDNTIWDISLFGSYNGPIDLFDNHFEDDLKAAYSKQSKPLGFRLGYNHNSNVLFALKK